VNPARQTLHILILAAVLCVGWTVVVRSLPRAELAETNYEANRLRIERWLLDPPASNVIVGTSISGRLQPSFFEGTALASMANLGLDGGNPETGLALVLARPTPPALVFLEVHRLRMPPGDNDQQMLDLIRGLGLKVSRQIPLTRADQRPSTALYAWLKRHRPEGGGAEPRTNVAEAEAAVVAEDPQWSERIGRLVKSVEARGTRVILLQLPVGRENPMDPEATNFGTEASGRLGLRLMDLYRLSVQSGEKVAYTDGLHLTTRSASRLARQLADDFDRSSR